MSDEDEPQPAPPRAPQVLPELVAPMARVQVTAGSGQTMTWRIGIDGHVELQNVLQLSDVDATRITVATEQAILSAAALPQTLRFTGPDLQLRVEHLPAGGTDDGGIPLPLLDSEQQTQLAVEAKRRGGVLYAAGEVPLAIHCYGQSVQHVQLIRHLHSQALPADLHSLLVANYANLAACHLALAGEVPVAEPGTPDGLARTTLLRNAVQAADRALALDGSHVKALLRKARALRLLRDAKGARDAMAMLLRLEPDDKLVLQENAAVEALYRVEKARLHQTFQALFK